MPDWTPSPPSQTEVQDLKNLASMPGIGTLSSQSRRDAYRRAVPSLAGAPDQFLDEVHQGLAPAPLSSTPPPGVSVAMDSKGKPATGSAARAVVNVPGASLSMEQTSPWSVVGNIAASPLGPGVQGAKIASLIGPKIFKDYQPGPESATESWDKSWGSLMNKFAESPGAQAGISAASAVTGMPLQAGIRMMAGGARSVAKVSDFLQSPVGALTLVSGAAFPSVVGTAALSMGGWNTLKEGLDAIQNPTPEKVGEVIADALLLYGGKSAITKTKVASPEPNGQPGFMGRVSGKTLEWIVNRIANNHPGNDPRSVQMRASLDDIVNETNARGTQPLPGSSAPPKGPTPISGGPSTPPLPEEGGGSGGAASPRSPAPPAPAGNVETQEVVGPDGRVQQIQVQTQAEGPPPPQGKTLLDQIVEKENPLGPPRSAPPPNAAATATPPTAPPSGVAALSNAALGSMLQVEQDRNKRNVLLDEATRRGLHPPDYRRLTDNALQAQWGAESNPQKLQKLNTEAQARGIDLGVPPQRPESTSEEDAKVFAAQADKRFDQTRQKPAGPAVPDAGESDLDQRARAIADGYKVDYDALDEGDKQALRTLVTEGHGSVGRPAPAPPAKPQPPVSNVLSKTSTPSPKGGPATPAIPPVAAMPPVQATPPAAQAPVGGLALAAGHASEAPEPTIPAVAAAEAPAKGEAQPTAPITDNGNPPQKTAAGAPPWSNPAHDARYLEESARNAMYVQPGNPEAPAPPIGDQLKFPTALIEADPERFQFKMDAIGKGGTSDDMRDIQAWDPAKAGTILVWKDPEDGKVYVSNGHHRLERAKALGVPWMDVRFINDQAPDAASARAVGAIANITEGHGTAVDAAKVFRDGKLTPEQLAKENIPMKGKLVQQGMALAQLAPAVFSQVVNGDLTPERGAVIGELMPDHEQQKAAVKVLEMGERKGKILNDRELRDLIGRVQRGPQKLETDADRKQQTMWDFGDVMRSYAFEAAQLSNYVRERIGKEKRLFGAVSKNTGALEKGGNKINAEKSQEIAQAAKTAQELYDRLYDKDVSIDAAINEAARKVAEKETTYNDAAEQLYDWVREKLDQTLNPSKAAKSGKDNPVAAGKPSDQQQPVRTGGQAGPEAKVEPKPDTKPASAPKPKKAAAPAPKKDAAPKSSPPPAEPAKKLSDMSMEEAFAAFQQAKKKVSSPLRQKSAQQDSAPALQFSEAPPSAVSAEYQEFLDWYETIIAAELANGDIAPDSPKAEKFYKMFPAIGEKYAPKENAPKQPAASHNAPAGGTAAANHRPNAGAEGGSGRQPGQSELEPSGGAGNVAGSANAASDGIDLANKTIVTVGNPPDVDTSAVPKPRTATLAPHQAKAAAAAIKAMDRIGGFLNAGGTGSGKTPVSAAVSRHYLDAGHPVFLVGPAEVFKFPNSTEGMPRSSYKFWFDQYGIVPERYTGQQSFEPGKLYISTYEKFASAPVDGNTVFIIEESHYLKNLGDSARSEAGVNLIDRAHSALFLTATPADKPYHIGYLKKMGLLEGKSEMQAIGDLGMVLVPRKNQKTGKTFTRWEVREGVDPKTVRRKFVDLFTRMIENGNMRKDEIMLDGLDIQAMNIHLPEEGQEVQAFLQQAMTTPNMAVRLMHLRRQQEPYKIDATMDLIKHELRQGRKVVVFASRVNRSDVINRHRDPRSGDMVEEVIHSSEGTLKTLKRRLQEEGITRIAELHGAAEEKGAAAMDRFQSGGADVIIATAKSGGTGIDLDDTRGNAPRSVVVMTPEFDAMSNVQLLGRIYRMSTKSNGRVFYLFADTKIDRWNASIFSEKMKTLASVVQGESKKMDVAQFFGAAADDELKAYLSGSAVAKKRPLRGAKYGDYIEFFDADAQAVADATGLPIHKARSGKEITGFPVKDLSLYQKQLNDKGFSFNYIDRSPTELAYRRNAQPLMQRSAPTPGTERTYAVWIDPNGETIPIAESHSWSAKRMTGITDQDEAQDHLIKAGYARVSGISVEIGDGASPKTMDAAVEFAVSVARSQGSPRIEVHFTNGGGWQYVPLADVGEMLANPKRYLRGEPLLQRTAPPPSAEQEDLFDKALREVDLSPAARRAARGATVYHPEVLERWIDPAGKEIEIRRLDEHSFWKYLQHQDVSIETFADFQAKYPAAKYYSVYRSPHGFVFNFSAVSRNVNTLRPRGGTKVEKFTSPIADGHLDIASHFIEQSQPPHGYAKHTPEEWQRRRVANEPASGMPPMFQKSDVLPKTSPPPGKAHALAGAETIDLFPEGEAARLEQEHALDRAILEAQRLSAEFGSPLTRTNLRKALKKAKLPEQGNIFSGPLEEDEGNGLLFARPFSDVPFDRSMSPDAMIESARMRYYPMRNDANARPGRLYLNRAGVEILRGAFAQLKWDSGMMDGVQLGASSVRDINAVLRKTPTRARMSAGAVQVLDQLADTLSRALADSFSQFTIIHAGNGRSIAEVKATVSHEASHAMQMWMAILSKPFLEMLVASRSLPNYEKAAQMLIKRWRYPDQKIAIFQEILAHALAGQHERLGLTESESLDLLFDIRQNALSSYQEKADELFKYGRPGIRKALSERSTDRLRRTALPPGAAGNARQVGAGG